MYRTHDRPLAALFVVISLGALGALGAVAALSATAAPANAAPATRRIELPAPDGRTYPYTVEIPADWQVRPEPGQKGTWLAPAGVDPGKDPRAIFVRPSPANLTDPAATVRSIEESDRQNDTWAAPLVAVKEVGGARGVLVQMDSGQGVTARSLLVLKLPVGTTSVDLMGVAPRPSFPTLRPAYEKVLFSVRPAQK
jgi:hypothetical protein